MRTSPYFQKVLFYDNTPAIDDYFESRVGQLFEQSRERSYIEIHVQQPLRKVDAKNKGVPDAVSETLEWGSELESDASADPSSPAEKSCYSSGLLHYDGAPALRRKISDAHILREVALRSEDLFRICYLDQRHTYSRLQLTEKLFQTLMIELRIFPRFKDFVVLFGARHSESESGLPQLRFHRIFSDASDTARRVCSGIECAYALRYADLNHRNEHRPWSIRQTAVYQRCIYMANSNPSTWVLIAASRRTKWSLKRYTKSSTNLTALNPFETHLILLDSLLGNWRPYIAHLTTHITEQSDKVLVASITEKNPIQLVNIEERQILKDSEDRLVDILLVLDSTLDTITSLLSTYNRFCRDCRTRLADDDDSSDSFDFVEAALRKQHRAVSSYRRQIETLHTKVQGTIQLLSSLLDLGNGNSLKELAEEARQENTTMRKLTEKSTRDAAAVKVLTMITLIYLPVTVVGNFFSTVFVGTNTESNKVTLTSDAWLFAEISVPLTVGTLFIWWVWVRFQAYQGQYFRRTWPFKRFYPVERHRDRITEDLPHELDLR